MKKILIFILTYDADAHIIGLLDRIPPELFKTPDFHCDLLLIDDCSKDNTVQVAREHAQKLNLPITILQNPVNQGYGGNQKIGYTYAIQSGYDIVVMLHGDGQYPPEMIRNLIDPLLKNDADAVLGSRMIHKRSALAGGMPFYKFVGNIVLTKLQNILLGSSLSEFHTGFRAYATSTLRMLPFSENSNDFDFDTDILIQCILAQKRIREIPIPTHYGNEVCHVNGMKYATQILYSSFLKRCQKLNIFFQPKFDIKPQDEKEIVYQDKTHFNSSHSWALKQIPADSTVLDIGCGSGAYVAQKLVDKGCIIYALDYPASIPDYKTEISYRQANIDSDEFQLLPHERSVTSILFLDVIEHLNHPEQFMRKLSMALQESRPTIYLTTPNVAFFITRLALLFGQFNYGKRGILDITHKRLFTFYSLKRLLKSQGYHIASMEGIPAPFPLALPGKKLGYALLKINQWLIAISPRIFSYQIAVAVKPLPTLDKLLSDAVVVYESNS